jgi:DNA-binding IclR family transcriptional regulator
MAALASRSGDTSFLTIRSGTETICIDRQSGSYPVKAFTVDVGTRRALGVGAGSIALLAAMEPAQAERLLDAAQGTRNGAAAAASQQLRKAVAQARQRGYAYSEGLVLKGVRGLAVAILDAEARPVAALSLAAIDDRMKPARVPELVRMLHAHARRIEQRLGAAEGRDKGVQSRRVRAG